MNRLYAFGCSCTYGVGLPDIDIELNKGSSKYSWPEKLAEKLNLTCVNKGWPGASNLEILNRILNTKISSDDTVVVMWSFFNRDYIFNENGTGTQLAHWVNPGLIRNWMLTHSDYDLKIRSWLAMYTAWLHLDAMDIKFYFGITGDVINNPNKERFLEIKPVWADNIKFVVTDFMDLANNNDLAVDNMHPGPKSHAKLAEILFEYIRNDKRI